MELEFNMNMFNSKLLVAGLLSASVMVGCGSDSSADKDSPTVTNGSLTAALGALSGATCDITNAAGSTLETVTTGADGSVSITIETVGSDFPLIVSCTDGTYFDEANPDDPAKTNESVIKSIVPDLATFNNVGGNVAVTTLTDLAVELYNSLPAGDKTVETALASLDEIVRVLAPELGTGGGGVNLLAAPTPVTAGDTVVPNTPAGVYASYLAGLAQVAKDKGISPAELGALLAEDVANGDPIDADTVSDLGSSAASFAADKGFTVTGTTGDGGAAVKPTPTGTGGTATGG
ncbi:hypothetical protein C0068_18880 [Zhongshania marina]|uniref:Uncharacterized protein n=2 Tax=Zhongshania marina TaxID=2304603 RepID=A0A2S4HBF5_9GAMM|nr:hypothetical protein C0068_18880 [Marortus luteolus]